MSIDDEDGNGLLSGAETFIDTEEPYLDINNNVTFDAGDIPIEADGITGHSAPNGVYDGQYCDSTSRGDCVTSLLVPIHMKIFMTLM